MLRMSGFSKLVIASVVLFGVMFFLISARPDTPNVTKTPPPEQPTTETTPRSYYEPLIPWQIGSKAVFASLANNTEARTLGLSYTTELPADIVKVFVFDTDERWSFWMKGMQYPIDIIWVTATGTVAHIEYGVLPETYPTAFTPPVPSRYVIETVPGLFTEAGITVGESLGMSAVIEKKP